MIDGHGGVTIGSEISGGVRNVFAYDCVMDSPNLDRALRLKNNAMRGGVLENIFMRDVQIGQVADSILSIDFTYEEGAKGPFKAIARHRHKNVILYRQGGINFIINAEPDSFAQRFARLHGPLDGGTAGGA